MQSVGRRARAADTPGVARVATAADVSDEQVVVRAWVRGGHGQVGGQGGHDCEGRSDGELHVGRKLVG